MKRIKTTRCRRICQGDIFRNIEYLYGITEEDGIIEISKIVFPFSIILTQDCDLNQDYILRNEKKPEQDKRLFSVLVAPLYNAEHVFSGVHLEELDISSVRISKSKYGSLVKKNQLPRYHYIDFSPSSGLVPAIIDFKHYFSSNRQYLEIRKRSDFVCSVNSLFRDDISHRFAAFLSRIGLPE